MSATMERVGPSTDPETAACEWQPVVTVMMLLALGIVCWFACAYLGAGIGWVFGYPEIGGIAGAFGIPCVAVLINGGGNVRR